MSEESLLQTFFIDLFFRGIYYVLRFYVDCVGITCYWSETIFIISLIKKIFVFGILFEKTFSSNILASFTEVECQGTDTFGFVRIQTIEIHI